MKKIFLSILFIVLSVSMKAQNLVDRETIKNSPNELVQFVNEDILILKNNFKEITDYHERALSEIYYNKYKSLIADLSNEELKEIIDSTKARTRVILGDDLYLKVSENKDVFYRITGLGYLIQ